MIGLLGGCTFALDDPAPFIVEAQPDPDGFVPQDMALDGSRSDARLDSQASDGPLPDHALDAHPDVMIALPDVAVVIPDVAVADMRVPDIARPDMLIIPDMAPPCIPQDETCDGTDEDCDGQIDEEALGLCDLCETGQLGVCAVGRQLCVEGITTCVTYLPEDVGFPCDRVDLDCDGQLDEGDEVPPVGDDLTAAVITACGAREAVPAPIADCSVEPRRVGCSPSHACVPPGCRVRCETAFAESQDRNTLDACLAACPADSRASRWICAEGPEGPTCTATDCPEGEQPDGRRCVPIVEICNNGIDDDDDGLIDGTIEGDDPCMAAIDQRGQPTVSGICSGSNGAGCEDTLQMIAGGLVNDDSVCLGPSCPRIVDLDYVYAIDREEVSIRAYAECVASGCCLPPSSRTYRLGAQAIADGLSAERVAEPERCAAALDELDPGTLPLLPELPVTGVTWCQARDYCNWVGKRLPTDYEWERAASGLERRAFPWGNEVPAQCSENQCCTAPDFEGDLPGLCGGDTPICSDEIPARTRLACLANYGYDVEGCDPVIGPTPVYGNADGDTPEGIRNLSGNVAEWTFDWLGQNIAQTSRQNPVGAACDHTFFPGKRTVRGEGFTGVLEGIRAIDRAGLFPQVRAPMLGFRCARTQPEDGGACDPQTPQIPQECQAGADIRVAQPGQPIGAACTAPDFASAPPADAAECLGLNLGRLGSGQCNDGLQDYCASDQQIGCGAFLLSRLRLPPGVLPNTSWSNIANTVFDSTLGPRGGSSLFAFELPEAFETNVNREWRMTIGSAQIDVDGRLSWLGKFDAGICSRQEISSFRVRTVQGQRTVLPVCGEAGRARISLRDAPISIIFSGIGIQMTHIPAAGLLQGKLVFAVTVQDTEESTFGPTGSGVSQLVNNLGLDPQNLCAISNPFLGPNCLAHRLQLEGCDNQACNNPETCTGYLLPFDFEAIRSTQAGIIGLDGCAME